MLFFLYKIG